MPRKRTHEEYLLLLIDKSIVYTPVDKYICANTKILHLCPNCKTEWKVTPSYILSGRGKCTVCFDNFKRQKTTEEYTTELLGKGIEYKCLQSYITARTPILHCCPAGHEWLVRPDNVLRGDKCPSCASYGFNPSLPAILYYIKISNDIGETYYKIGITNNDVSTRFKQEKDKSINILLVKEFNIGSDAKAEEVSILKTYHDKRVKVPNFLKSRGNTELFEIDILGLDP
jgi:hypothetical protein